MSHSTLIQALQNILIDAEAANTQLSTIAIRNNNVCKELLEVHKVVHKLHSKIENMDTAMGSSVSLSNDAIQVFNDLSSVFVSLATHSSDLSLNPEAVKCTESMPAYNEGIGVMLAYNSTMLSIFGMANDVGSMADHVLKMSDKILIESGVVKEKAKPLLLSQKIQGENLKLTQALVLVAQRNSLSPLSNLNNGSDSSDLNSQIFIGHNISSDAASAFLTRFNMAREWGHIEVGVEELVDHVNATFKKRKSFKKDNNLSINSDSYIAVTELSVMVKSVAEAIDKMAITTERLSFSTDDEILRDSVNSMMRMSTQLINLAERVREIADITLSRGNAIGLSANQLVAAKQLQEINYKMALLSAESTQEKVIHITEINSL
ncbi:MAG: hypothetical protein OQK72_05945 [Gammaproteobacteria bacterium]|nr:hypothetical protein [Gammaproteobacteria bacterium]